jgi:hypothetical protein
MHQDDGRQLMAFGGSERAKHRAVDHQQVRGLTRQCITHIVKVGRRYQYSGDHGCQHITVRRDVEHTVGTLKHFKTEPMRFDTRLLTFVSGESYVMSSLS